MATQPWMRKEVLNRFGRTVKNRWTLPEAAKKAFTDPLRQDIAPLPIKERIRYWKLARGDRVTFQNKNRYADEKLGTSSERRMQGPRRRNNSN